MPETLPQLEMQRAQVVQDIAGLGDFCRGSITSITARCGKAHCACHQPGHPGHGPNFRLTRKVQGKTVSETFSHPAALRKAEREDGGVPPVSGTECKLGGGERKDLPVASGGGRRGVERGGKKTTAAIQQAIAREVKQLLPVIFRAQRQSGRLDLEAVEMAVRATVHRAGAAALAELLRFPAPTAERRTQACPCGRKAHYRELRTKPVRRPWAGWKSPAPTMGARTVTPANFLPMSNWTSKTPELSPGVRRRQALVGQEAPFDHGRESRATAMPKGRFPPR